MSPVRRFRQSLLASFLVLVVAVPADAADRAVSDVADVVAVEVPVEVTLDGKPVTGLQASDFEIFDGRKRQEITGFDVIDLAAPTARPLGAGQRRFLLLFDLSFSEPAALVRARSAARDMVDRELHPSDLIGVATYGVNTGPQLVLNFTADRRQVGIAIDTLGLPQLVDRSPDPLRLVLGEPRELAGGSTGLASDAGGGRGALLALEEARELAGLAERTDREAMASKIAALSTSLGSLARSLAAIEGRKHVVYLSQGFDSSILVGNEQESEEDRAARESGEIWRLGTSTTFGDSRVQNAVEKMLEEFRRADCVIHSVDIGGLSAGADQAARASGTAGLLLMARDTGGELYQNFNNLGDAMDRMLERSRVTYVLAFQPDELDFDGSYHRVNVKLRNPQRGMRVTHRPGYYAPKTFGQRTAAERQLQTAGTLLGGREGGGLDLEVIAAPFRAAASGTSWVPVLLEVGGPSLLAGHTGDQVTIEVYVYALDEQRTVRDFIVQSIGLDLTKAPPALRQNGLKFFGHLDLEPGAYDVRAMARNGQTGVQALRSLDVEVAAADGLAGVLLPPLFPEPMGRWLITRETTPPGEPQPAYPFMLADTPFVPSAKAIVGDAPRQMALIGYNLGQAESFQIEVRTLDGQMVRSSPLADLQRVAAPAGSHMLVANFEAQGLKPGLYHVSVSAKQGGASVSSAPVVVEVAASS
jgi:VWFA-related protein